MLLVETWHNLEKEWRVRSKATIVNGTIHSVWYFSYTCTPTPTPQCHKNRVAVAKRYMHQDPRMTCFRTGRKGGGARLCGERQCGRVERWLRRGVAWWGAPTPAPPSTHLQPNEPDRYSIDDQVDFQTAVVGVMAGAE